MKSHHRHAPLKSIVGKDDDRVDVVGSKRKRVCFGGDFGTKVSLRDGQTSVLASSQQQTTTQKSSGAKRMEYKSDDEAPSDEDRSFQRRKKGSSSNNYDDDDDESKSHDENMEVGEDEVGDDQLEDEDYDDYNYILTPSYTEAELEEIFPRFQRLLAEEVTKVEKDPYGAFVAYKQELKERQQQEEGQLSESLQQAIEEATIRGDPREYQRRLTEIAKQRNTIIHLGTGAGKTLIALLCIQQFSKDFEDGKKQTLFMVPSVALAIQQSTTLKANLPEFSVRTACYTNTNTDVARDQLKNANIIVATHGAIYDLLRHYGDMFQMNRFNLVVIDECHYAIGNHPYALVMNKFYHSLPPQDRPHVLGLTASPLVNVKETHSDDQLREMLVNLENTLDSKLISLSKVALDGDDPTDLSKSAEERVILYKSTNTGKALPSAENLPLHQSRFREFRQLNQLYQDLGPLVLSIYSKVLIRELSINSFEQETPIQFSQALQHLNRIATFCDQECTILPCEGRSDKLLALEELLDEQVEEQGGAETVGLIFVERRITAMALYTYFLNREERCGQSRRWKKASTARIDVEKTIREVVSPPHTKDTGSDEQFEDADDDPFMVFSDNKVFSARETGFSQLDADEIMTEQSAVDTSSRTNNIRAAVLVRHPTRIFKSLAKGTHPSGDQIDDSNWLHAETKARDVLAKLRNKETNVLIATSVVEEGVDVQACSFVVAFDSLKTSKGYIQMKGRARQEDAKFFVFQDHSLTGKSGLLLSTAQEMERRVRDFIDNQEKDADLPFDTLEDRENKGIGESQSISSELTAIETGNYCVEHATVDLPSAKSLLNRYALAVPMDPTLRILKESLTSRLPIYQPNRLILPAHLPKHVRIIDLPEKYCDRPRKEKQRMLALMACVRLHHHGLLNNRLLPLSKRDLDELIGSVDTRAPKNVNLSLPYDRMALTDAGKEQKVHVYSIVMTSPSLSRWREIFGSEGHTLALVTFEPIEITISPMKFAHPELGVVQISLGSRKELTCDKGQIDLLTATFILMMNDRWRRKSRNMFFELCGKLDYNDTISPYLVGISNINGDLDWDFMKHLGWESLRSKDERTAVVVNATRDKSLPKPRIWTALYDQNIAYISFGPSGETCCTEFPNRKEGIETYHDYFLKERNYEVKHDSLLFEVQRLWHRPNNLPLSKTPLDNDDSPPTVKTPTSKFVVCPELASVKLSQDASCEATLANVDITLLCTFLPQFLYMLERDLRVESFVNHCKNNFPILGECLASDLSRDDIAVALTAKSCGLDVSYEKLEWLGDAVLKLVQTDSIIMSSKLEELVPYLHEGDLSSIREVMGSNSRLEKVCKHICFNRFSMAVPLGRGKWLPCCIKYSEGTEVSKGDERTGKIFADIIESLLGVIYLRSGYEKSLLVANELHLILPWEKKTLSSHRNNPTEGKLDLANSVTRLTGYSSFRRPELAIEALTHPSAFHPAVPSYQRLEWIGDAVLCLAARKWIFESLDSISLGDMVAIEAALVSNETLAYISLKSKLTHHLHHRDQSLPARIEKYDWSIRKQGRGLWGVDPPKAISDIVESIIGAVHTDGGFSEGQKAALKILQPILNVIVQSTNFSSIQHPKKLLQELSGEFLGVSAYGEAEFASRYPAHQAWFGKNWGLANSSGSSYLGCIQLLGSTVLAIAEPSSTVSRNRVCGIAVAALAKDDSLRTRLEKCRTRAEREISHSTKTEEESTESTSDDAPRKMDTEE